MLRRSFLTFAVMCIAAPAALAHDDPVAHVREMYEVQLKGEKTKKYVWDKPHIEKFFTRGLAGRIRRTQSGSGIDFDFLFDGQDFAITELTYALVDRKGNAARVEARFKNHKEPKRVTFHMVKQGGEWRVSDVSTTGAHAWTLTKLLDK